MKRIIALLLVVFMLGMALIACGKKEPAGNKPSEKPTETEQPTDEMGQPDLEVDRNRWADFDFEGEQLNIFVLNDEKVRYEWETEDPGDDELDQQIALRNEVVESTLNLDVNIVLTQTNSGQGAWQHSAWETEFTQAITQDIDNKLHELDAVANFGFDGLSDTLRPYYANVLDTDTFPHFKFDLPCWNQSILKNGTMNGQLYGIAGDMNLSLFNCALIIWQNDDLYEQARGEEDPQYIQELATQGLWTYQELYRWAKWSEVDAELGDCYGHYGVQIQGDQYAENPSEAIPYAWGVQFITTKDDGTHEYQFVGNQRAEDALIALCNLYNAEGNFWRVNNSNKDKNRSCSCAGGHFVQGGIMFKGDVLYWDKNSNRQIREMEDQYSLLPWPTYDVAESSDEICRTTSQGFFNVISILDHSESATTTKGEEISAYFQYGTEYSYTYVRGYYFERIVKLKFFGTDDSTGRVTRSSQIFVNIVEKLDFNFATIYSPALNKIIPACFKAPYKACAGGGTPGSVQSAYEAQKDIFDEALVNLEAWFGVTQ